jgi:biopolymer transport protein ExbD
VRRNRERARAEAAHLEMTPMIDVVFQLLIFFIVTLKQEDILSHLDISRPAPDPTVTEEKVQDLLTITVHRNGYLVRGRARSPREMERHLERLASYSKNLSVIIKCTPESQHKLLVELLNLCARAGLKNISVFSM